MCVENLFILGYMVSVLAVVLILSGVMKYREIVARKKYLKEIRKC